MVITMAKLRMAHASTHGARKPPGPKLLDVKMIYFCLLYFNIEHSCFIVNNAGNEIEKQYLGPFQWATWAKTICEGEPFDTL